MSRLLASIEAGDLSGTIRLLDQVTFNKRELDDALLEASRLGRVEHLDTLVSKGANLLARNEATGWTALHVAVEHDQKDALRRLVHLGLDVDARDGAGATALHLAVDAAADAVEQVGVGLDTSTVELLLTLGANSEARDEDGATPADWAADAGHPRLIEVLGG